MPDTPPPTTISELWFRLDKRLALIETAQAAHCDRHDDIKKTLDDHEARIRSGLTFTALTTGGGGILALIAIIKSFFTP